MLKKFLLFIAALSFASAVSATESDVFAGDWVPWPFGSEQEFPWSEIQGMWKAQGPGYAAYFSLRVTMQKADGLRILKVKQLDANTCRILGTGVGTEEDSTVRVLMSSKEGRTFRVMFRAFDVHDSPEPRLPSLLENSNHIILLTVSSLGSNLSDAMHMQISKVSDAVAAKGCLENLEKNRK